MGNVVNLAGENLDEEQDKFVDALEIALEHAKSNKLRGLVITSIDHAGTERLWATDHATSYYELIGALHVTIATLIKEES